MPAVIRSCIAQYHNSIIKLCVVLHYPATATVSFVIIVDSSLVIVYCFYTAMRIGKAV